MTSGLKQESGLKIKWHRFFMPKLIAAVGARPLFSADNGIRLVSDPLSQNKNGTECEKGYKLNFFFFLP